MAAKKTKTRTRKARPKPPPRVRVAMKMPTLSESEAMDTFGGKLTAAADDHPTLYVNPPAIPPLKAALTTLGTAITDAQGGTDAAQVDLMAATLKVHDLIVQHAAWISTGANGMAPVDAISFITTAGFQVAKTAQRTPITSPEISNGTPGIVHLAFPALPGAIMWFSEVSLDGGKTYSRSVDDTHLKFDITGLPSGQTVLVRVRPFIRNSGYSPWTVLTIVVT